MSKNAVIGIAQNDTQADRIVTELRSSGFSDGEIFVLLPDKKGTRDFAHEKGTKMPEGAATGGAIGGTLGLLAGIGALAIPGLGPFIAAGPIMAALSGAAAGAATGGLTGALVGLGIPDYEAKQYESQVKYGNILMSVHTEDRDEQTRAKEIFDRNQAADIAVTGEAHA